MSHWPFGTNKSSISASKLLVCNLPLRSIHSTAHAGPSGPLTVILGLPDLRRTTSPVLNGGMGGAFYDLDFILTCSDRSLSYFLRKNLSMKYQITIVTITVAKPVNADLSLAKNAQIETIRNICIKMCRISSHRPSSGYIISLLSSLIWPFSGFFKNIHPKNIKAIQNHGI